MRQITQTMGMPISLDIPGQTSTEPFNQVFELFKAIDAQFSPYKSGSELNRYLRGEINDQDLSPQMLHVMDACKKLEKRTKGYFSAYFAGPFNPTGYVKGWAVQQAGRLLHDLGVDSFLLNAGGDILAQSSDGQIWSIGLQHPGNMDSVIGSITTRNLAIATSGTYVRGKHIIDPHTRQAADELLSVTTIGPDIAIADALATAAFAMGTTKGKRFMERQKNYQALFIDSELNATMTTGFAEHLKKQSAPKLPNS